MSDNFEIWLSQIDHELECEKKEREMFALAGVLVGLPAALSVILIGTILAISTALEKNQPKPLKTERHQLSVMIGDRSLKANAAQQKLNPN